MCKCIYTGVDETMASFKEAEHIFPKCIGGVRCLPRGYVSDEVNHALSKVELSFARDNPIVTVPRMFSPLIGRKKHTNRERVGVMRDTDNGAGYSLGVVRNGVPISLSQLTFTSELPEIVPREFHVRVTLAASMTMTKEQQLEQFWEKLTVYNGSPFCIKDKNLPSHTYLLGVQDKRWFLALPKAENPESIKPKLAKLVTEIAKMKPEQFLPADTTRIYTSRHHVEGGFTFAFNIMDYYRVCAKIAINCLAALKGRECVMDPTFDGVKKAILTGEGIGNYARMVEGESPALVSLSRFPEQISFGKKAHSVTFFQKDEGELMAVVSLFGGKIAVIVCLGNLGYSVETDFYICDWENNVDYTMVEAVVKIGKYDADEYEPPNAAAMDQKP